MFTHTLSKLLADRGLTSETKWFYVETEITGSDEEDDWFAENGVPDDDFTLQYHDDGLDGATPAFNFLDLLNKENAIKLWGDDVCKCCGSNDFTYYDDAPDYGFCNKCNLAHNRGGNHNIKLHELLDIYLSGGEQAVEARLVEMLINF